MKGSGNWVGASAGIEGGRSKESKAFPGVEPATGFGQAEVVAFDQFAAGWGKGC